MALSAASIFEVRTAGDDTNGGGFVTGAAGTDYSQQDAKNTVGADISTTDAVSAGTTTLTSVLGNFGTTIVGNIVYFEGGTGSIAAVRRQVTARASTTSITLDASIATSTGMTMNIGGALLSPGLAVGTATVAGQKIFVKSGTYTVTSATPNIVAGCLSLTATTRLEGYQTTRGDLLAKPLLQASGISTFTLVTLAATCDVVNMAVDGAAFTSSRGFAIGVRGLVSHSKALNCTNSGFVLTDGLCVLCEATGCSTVAAFVLSAASIYGCVAHDNTFTGFSAGDGGECVRCLADTCTGATSDGFATSANGAGPFISCTSYGNGRDGFRLGSAGHMVVNSLAETNTGVGFNATGSAVSLLACGYYNNTGGNTSGTFNNNISPVTGTGSFFTNAASGDFSLNSTGGGGADVRANAVPGVLTFGGTGYLDRGTLQHIDPTDSGGGRKIGGRLVS